MLEAGLTLLPESMPEPISKPVPDLVPEPVLGLMALDPIGPELDGWAVEDKGWLPSCPKVCGWRLVYSKRHQISIGASRGHLTCVNEA